MFSICGEVVSQISRPSLSLRVQIVLVSFARQEITNNTQRQTTPYFTTHPLWEPTPLNPCVTDYQNGTIEVPASATTASHVVVWFPREFTDAPDVKILSIKGPAGNKFSPEGLTSDTLRFSFNMLSPTPWASPLLVSWFATLQGEFGNTERS